MTLRNYNGAAALVLLMLCNPVHAQNTDAVEEIRRCAAMRDADSRLACYDALGNRDADARAADEPPAPEPQAAAAPAAATAAAATVVASDAAPERQAEPQPATQAAAAPAAEPATLPADIGGQEFEAQAEPQEPREARGTVTSCQKGPDKKWYFVFASGQVWKQVDSTRLRFEDCNFGASIDKDLFGYKMIIEGRADKIRVSRKK